MFLLDTNVVSEMRKLGTPRADPGVAAWAAGAAGADLHTSVIVLMEIEIGVLRMERRDPRQGDVLRRWYEGKVLPGFEGRVLPVDLDAARRGAALHVPDPRPARDALIAATALAHGLTVVTRNVSDFAGTQVPLVDPWGAA